MRLAGELGVASRIHFQGFVAEPLPWYAAADLYLRTNVVEADNLSSVQAMAAGLPVVGFNTGSEAELVNVAEHGLLATNRDPSALADAIRDLIGTGQRARMGEQGAAYARDHLSLDAVIRSCEQLYVDVATASAGMVKRRPEPSPR